MDEEFIEMLRPFLKYADDREITADSRLRDFGLDSMREVELLFAIEDRYHIEFPEDRLVDTTFETGGQLWAVIQQARGERALS